MLFLAMQVRVMAACMESQIDKQEYTASAQSRARDGTGGINQPSDVCGLGLASDLSQGVPHKDISLCGLQPDLGLKQPSPPTW